MGAGTPEALHSSLRWIYKIPRPFRFPVLTLGWCCATYLVHTNIVQWPPRDENGVRIPTCAGDPQYNHDRAYMMLKEMDNPFVFREHFRWWTEEYRRSKGISD